MKVAVKYFILMAGFFSAFSTVYYGNIGAGITAAGAFIAFTLLEINDLKITNDNED